MTNFLKEFIIRLQIYRQRSDMSQVIMILLFPIGLYFYFFVEKKARPVYDKVFTDFEEEIQAEHGLSQSQKLQRYREMLVKNDYSITDTTQTSIAGERKIFSMSLFAMSVGVYYVGAVIYLLYFFYVQKPHKILFNMQKED